MIASLFCGQVTAMDKFFDEDQEEQNKYVKPFLPTAQFKRLFVPLVLASTSEDAFSIMLDQLDDTHVVIYQLDGNNVAQCVCLNDEIRFESQDPNQYNFVLQSPLKTGSLTVATQGSFTFQAPVETQSASLTCKSVEFLNKFSSEKDLVLDVNYCDNCGDVTCADIIFQGNQFNNTTRESTLNVQGTATWLAKQGLFNYGIISCADDAFINTSSLANHGPFKAGILHFDGDKILNKDSINIDDFLLHNCKTFEHHGKMDIHNDCTFQKVGKFSTTQSSSWKVGGDWKAHIEDLSLRGNAIIGNSALFYVDSHAVLNGPFRAPVLYIDSKDFITCSYHAQLFITYYVGLKAKDWLQFDGDIFKTFVQENVQSKPSQKLQAILKAFPQRGVFLHSDRSGIKKVGKIIEKNGTVRLDAKRELTHTGLTEAGFGLESLLLMNAESLHLEKESMLKSLNARLTAKNTIDQFGTAQIEQQLVMEASNIAHSGSSQAESLSVKGDNISTMASSRMDVKNCSFEVEESISSAGNLVASGRISMKAQDITVEETSNISAKNAKVKASETLNNRGNFNIAENLSIRAPSVENPGLIAAKKVHIKTDPPQASFLSSWIKGSPLQLFVAGISVGALAYWIYTKCKATDKKAEEEEENESLDVEVEDDCQAEYPIEPVQA